MVSRIVLWWLFFKVVFGLSDVFIDFPNPQVHWRMCGRQKSSYVCDPDFIMERGQVERLDKIAEEMKVSTSCLCPDCPDETGIPIGIFVTRNLTKKSTSYSSGKELAEIIRQKWNLGACDDDIIIVLVTQLNITDFSLGASVQSVLSEGTAAQILDDCRIHFESGYFYQGLESVVNSFQDVIIKHQRKSIDSYNNLMIGLLIGFSALLVIVVGAAIVRLRQKRRSKKSCSNIYENESDQHNRKKLPDDHKDQLEKLNQNPYGDNEEEV